MVFSVVHRVDDHLVVLAQPERSLVAEVVVDDVLDLKLFRWHVLWLYGFINPVFF